MPTSDNPNFQGPFGNTLLHGAAMSGDTAEAHHLLQAGADPSIRNREGRTAADLAAMLGHLEWLEQLTPALHRRR